MAITIPERIRERFLNELLEMYGKGEISAGKAAEMLGIPRAAFCQLLAEKRVPLPEKLNQSILKELKKLRAGKDQVAGLLHAAVTSEVASELSIEKALKILECDPETDTKAGLQNAKLVLREQRKEYVKSLIFALTSSIVEDV